MKAFVQEYGKILTAVLCGIVFLGLLLYQGGLLEVFNEFQIEHPEVKNEAASQKLQELAARNQPEVVFASLELEIGSKRKLSDFIRSIQDEEGRDVTDRAAYYLADGTEVTGAYVVEAREPATVSFRLYVEDTERKYSSLPFAITVKERAEVTEALTFITAYDIAEQGSVQARVYQLEESGRYFLSIEGSGRAKGYHAPYAVPWLSDGYQNIESCRISEGVETPNVSYWFYQTEIQTMPEFHQAVQMDYTFYQCDRLRYGSIGETAASAEAAFSGCGQLLRCQNKSRVLSNLKQTFSGCRRLGGDLVLYRKPNNGAGCFKNTAAAGKHPLYLYAGSQGISGELASFVQAESNTQNRISYRGAVEDERAD